MKLKLLAVALAIGVTAVLPVQTSAASSVTIWPDDWERYGATSVGPDRGAKVVKMRLTSGTRITSDKAAAVFNANKNKYVKICVYSRSNGIGDGLTVYADALAPGYEGFWYRSTDYKERCMRQFVPEQQDAGWRKVKLKSFGAVGDRVDFIRYVTVTGS